ncbi:MAG: type 4b pilus protein PilO2 [Methyloprofundus sp.]|nr:type 4b pilus protein PilO2 [Methyloprofundus sp.]
MAEVETVSIQLGKNRFVAGLYWQPFYNKKDVKTLAKEAHAAFSVEIKSRSSDRPSLVGFASKAQSKKLKKRHYSLGSIVYEYALGLFEEPGLFNNSNIVAVLALPDDLFMLVMISEGLILKEVVGDQDAIRDELDSALGILQNTIKLVPDETWSSDGRVVITDDLIADIKLKSHALNPLSASSQQVLSLVLMASLSIGGYLIYDQYQQAEYQRLLELAKERQKQNQQDVEVKVILPWEEKPEPKTLWAACEKTFSKINPYPVGWKYSAMGCNESGATVSWIREFGLVADLLSAHPEAVVEHDGNKAVDNIQHAEEAQHRTQPAKLDNLMRKHEAINRINNLAQTYGFDLKVQAANAKDLPGQLNKPTAQHQIINIEITTSLLPVQNVLQLLTSPGLVIDQFATSETGVWIIKGALYVR